jgi:hypothetical protein
MKFLVTLVAVVASALFCGCGGGAKTLMSVTRTHRPAPPVGGNWEFTATPSAKGRTPMTISGGITQAGTAVDGALHVNGTTCFSTLTTVSLRGSADQGKLSMTSAAVDGQVVTMSGSLDNASFAGTYKIKGGCADGDEGSIVGTNIPYITNAMSGTFTNSMHETFNVAGEIAQNGSASADGSFGITGNATFDAPCFKTGMLRAGTYSGGSFILGSTVALEFETESGSLIFVGRLSADRSTINGSYELSGGACDGDGTALLSVASPGDSSPWDY